MKKSQEISKKKGKKQHDIHNNINQLENGEEEDANESADR